MFASVLYLAEEVSLLLSLGEAGQVAADHQVRVIQHSIEPTPGGQQGLDTQDTMFTTLGYMLPVWLKHLTDTTAVCNWNVLKNVEGNSI